MGATRYRLRAAAGSYWLLDLWQDGRDAKPPLELNESGAMLWELMEQGMDLEEMALFVSEHYGIERQAARADAGQFVERLKLAGIAL